MASMTGSTPLPTQVVRTGTQSNALTSNMVALRRFHRKAWWIGQGVQVLAGTLTAATSSTAITGSGTRFVSEVRPGDKLMKADGTTLLGFVLSVESNTALTLTANASSAQAGLTATTVPRLGFLNFGDSVATLKNQFVIPLLWRMLGSRGYSGAVGQGLGGVGAISTTGTVAAQNGGAGYDYTYNPTGEHTAIGAASSITFGVGGTGYTGNLFTAYLVEGPGQGTVSVELLDNNNTPQGAAQSHNLGQTPGGAAATAVALRIVRFNLGAAAVARRLRITTTAGTAILPFSPSFENTTVRGVHLTNLSRGGLNHPDILSCANPQLVSAYVADQRPDLATYEMREAGVGAPATVDATLPGILAMLSSGWSDTDWLFYGPTPGSVDAGLPKATCPSWIESEKTRAFALARGSAFFDGYTPLDSHETILAMDPSYDGNHVGAMFSARLAKLVIGQFGLDTFVNLPLTPAALATAAARTAKLSVAKSTGAGFDQDAGSLETDGFGYDLYAKLQRWFMITDSAGGNRALFASTNGSYGYGVIVTGKAGAFLSDASRYNPQDWAIEVTSAGVVTLRGKDGAGTALKSIALGTLA